jgi:putative MATE family efflux protein
MAREFGAKQYESLRKVVGSSTTLSIVFALLFLLLGQAVAKPVLLLLNTPAQILDGSLLYLRIMFLGIPIVMAYNLLATILRSLGDGQTPLYAMIVAALSNIILDVLFVLVFHLGIAGAAIATLIAQGISSIYCLLKIRKIDFMTLNKKHFALEPAMAGRLLSLGSPMAAQNAIIAVGGMIIQGVVNGYGVAFIGGFTAANKLYGVLEIAATSYGYAMITYVGQNLGASRIDRIKAGMARAVVVSLVTSALISGVMLLLGRHIIGAFISGTPEEVAAATQVGFTYLSVMSICLPVLYILHVIRSAVQGMGNTVLPMVSGIAEFVMRTGGVLILPAILGENGIFITEVLAWLGADLILIPSYFIMVKRVSR